jgi:spore germination protein YaaH
VILKDAGKRAALRQQIVRFFTAYPTYRGLSLDFESLPDDADPAYIAFIRELYGDLHSRNLRLYVNTAVAASDSDLKQIAANSDGIILMNYDEHQTTSDPGPIASQDWFVDNLRRVLKIVPKKKSFAP